MAVRAACIGSDNWGVSGSQAGTFAIWDSGTSDNDWSPLLYPLSNLDKIAFHSALDYIGVVQTVNYTYNFSAVSAGLSGREFDVNMGSHGQASKPFIIAQISLNGSDYYTVNGTTLINRGGGIRYPMQLFGRSVIILCDNSNLYLQAFEQGSLGAQTIYVRVHVLGRSFYANRPDNGINFKADTTHVEAGSGVFDTRRRYLQSPSPGQTPTLRHYGGETIRYNGSSWADAHLAQIGICTDIAKENVMGTSSFTSATASPLILNRTPTNFVFAGSGYVPDVIGFASGRIYMSDSSGASVFDTSRKTLAFTNEFKTSLTIPSHGPNGNAYGGGITMTETVHYSQPVVSGADVIFGWMQITSSSGVIFVERPIEFSGALLVATSYYHDPQYVSDLNYCIASSWIFPRISGGNLQIVERWISFYPEGTVHFTLPSYTAQFHMFVGKMIGGL